MPPKKPTAPAGGAAAVAVDEDAFSALLPLWSDAALAAVPFGEAFVDTHEYALPAVAAAVRVLANGRAALRDGGDASAGAIEWRAPAEAFGLPTATPVPVVVPRAPDGAPARWAPAHADTRTLPVARGLMSVFQAVGLRMTSTPDAPRAAHDGGGSSDDAAADAVDATLSSASAARGLPAPARTDAPRALWELVHPRGADGALASAGGRARVKLFVWGRWRAVDVDTRVPCWASSGACALPRTRVAELWPVLLAKAVLKAVSLGAVGDAAVRAMAAAASGHAVVAHMLTGWQPERVARVADVYGRVRDLLERGTPFYAAEQPGALESDVAARLERGLPVDVAYAVDRALVAQWAVRKRFVQQQIERRLLRMFCVSAEWQGEFSDADLATWSCELEEVLGEHQHARARAKEGDFYIGAEDANLLFRSLWILHAEADDSSSAPAAVLAKKPGAAAPLPCALFVAGERGQTVDVVVSAQHAGGGSGAREAVVSLSAYDWRHNRTEAVVVTIVADPVRAARATIDCGTVYVLACSGVDDASSWLSVTVRAAGSPAAVQVGALHEMLRDAAGVSVLEQAVPLAAGAGVPPLTVHGWLTAEVPAGTTLSATLLHDAAEQALALSALAYDAGGDLNAAKRLASLGNVVDCVLLDGAASLCVAAHGASAKSAAVSGSATLRVLSSAPLTPSWTAVKARPQQSGSVTLQRARWADAHAMPVLAAVALRPKQDGMAAAVLTASQPLGLPLVAELLVERGVVLQARGRGAVVLPAFAVKAESDPAPQKGQPPPIAAYRHVLVLRLDTKRLAASDLPAGTVDDLAVQWSVQACTSLDDKSAVLVLDDERHKRLAAAREAWELAEKGRAAKAADARSKFVRARASGDWGADGAPPSVPAIHATAPSQVEYDVSSVARLQAELEELRTGHRVLVDENRARVDAGGARRKERNAAVQQQCTAQHGAFVEWSEPLQGERQAIAATVRQLTGQPEPVPDKAAAGKGAKAPAKK